MDFVIENIDQLNAQFDRGLHPSQFGEKCNRVIVECEFELVDLANYNPKGSVTFSSCIFKKDVSVGSNENNLTFKNCEFEGQLDCSDSKFQRKVRFKPCIFHRKLNLNNTTFKGLADFHRSTFKEDVIFYKTDFEDVTVFSAATFEGNALYTYSLIQKLILFRGTVFENGLDLSLAIIPGQIGVFDVTLTDFKCIKGKLDDEEFEKAVSENGEIPIKNKRETLRIFKQQHEKSSNTVESIPFKVLEKETLLIEHRVNLYRKRKKDIKGKPEELKKFLIEKWKSVFDLIVLRLNWLSNYFGAAYIQGLIFTMGVGILFYYLTAISTTKYEFAWSIDWSIISDNIPNYANFLLPTHKFDYLGSEFLAQYKLANTYFLWDILGRMFIGYGIYQTVQAFRKFK